MNMKNTRRFKGEYAADGPQRREKVRQNAGHRCIRCGHPFENGKHGKGEWSPCDRQCTHRGPLRIGSYNASLEFLGLEIGDPELAAGKIIARGSYVEAQWRILTVHHLDGDKANDWWANTLALCQRCHLTIQVRVDPRNPWFLEHSTWFKPFAAAWYAKIYEGRIITKEEAAERIDELLAYELNGGISLRNSENGGTFKE